MKNKKALSFTILMIATLQMGGMGLAPSLAAIQADLPNVPTSIVQTITSFPSFIMIFVCLLAAKLSERISKKSILLFGVTAISAVGLLGYFFNSSIVLLYVWAGLLGVGFGTILPACSGIIAENYDEQGRRGIMGIQSVFTNIGAMYLTYVGGALAVINWHLNYLVYLYGLISLICGLLFLPNDKPNRAQVQTDKVKISSLNPKTWVYGAFTFLFLICFGVYSANIAFFVMETGIGNPATIGTLMAVCTIGGMLGGATFNPVAGKFGNYTFSAAYVVIIIGLLLTAYANNLIAAYIGAIFVGISISWTIPQTMLSLTNCNTVAAATLACSVGHIGGQLGTFSSSLIMTPITGLFSDTTVFRYVFTAGLCAVLAVVSAIVVAKMDRKMPQASR